MDDAVTMSLGKSFYNAGEEFVDPFWCDGLAAGKELPEAFAFDVFQDKKRQAGSGFAKVEDSAQIGVPETGQGVNFGAYQFFDNFWFVNLIEHFNDDQPIGEEFVGGDEDSSRAAFLQAGVDKVSGFQPLAWLRRGSRRFL